MTASVQLTDEPIRDRELDGLLLQARGLVLVREILARRGASRAELDAHTQELERVRSALVERIGSRYGTRTILPRVCPPARSRRAAPVSASG